MHAQKFIVFYFISLQVELTCQEYLDFEAFQVWTIFEMYLHLFDRMEINVPLVKLNSELIQLWESS